MDMDIMSVKQGKMMRGTTTAQKHQEIETRYDHQETPHTFLLLNDFPLQESNTTQNVEYPGGLSQRRCLHYGPTVLNVKPIAPTSVKE